MLSLAARSPLIVLPVFLLLLSSSASAWKKDELWNYSQAPFCKRARGRKPHFITSLYGTDILLPGLDDNRILFSPLLPYLFFFFFSLSLWQRPLPPSLPLRQPRADRATTELCHQQIEDVGQSLSIVEKLTRCFSWLSSIFKRNKVEPICCHPPLESSEGLLPWNLGDRLLLEHSCGEALIIFSGTGKRETIIRPLLIPFWILGYEIIRASACSRTLWPSTDTIGHHLSR